MPVRGIHPHVNKCGSVYVAPIPIYNNGAMVNVASISTNNCVNVYVAPIQHRRHSELPDADIGIRDSRWLLAGGRWLAEQFRRLFVGDFLSGLGLNMVDEGAEQVAGACQVVFFNRRLGVFEFFDEAVFEPPGQLS